jgi:hypothetical protein
MAIVAVKQIIIQIGRSDLLIIEASMEGFNKGILLKTRYEIPGYFPVIFR